MAEWLKSVITYKCSSIDFCANKRRWRTPIEQNDWSTNNNGLTIKPIKIETNQLIITVITIRHGCDIEDGLQDGSMAETLDRKKGNLSSSWPRSHWTFQFEIRLTLPTTIETMFTIYRTLHNWQNYNCTPDYNADNIGFDIELADKLPGYHRALRLWRKHAQP